jgi:predicted DNA-binding transcriptional regulator AlpA
MPNLRVQNAAAYLGLSKSNLDKMRCYGGGPKYFKVGRSVIYSTDALDAWLAMRSRDSTWSAGNDNQTTYAARKVA